MWLLKTDTRQLEYFVDERSTNYAILSHTWDEEEVTYQDLQSRIAEHRKGYQKIVFTCQQALEDGIPYAWIDTCCINKSSSAELSEAINSMWRWYYEAEVCYAFLPDVPEGCRHLPEAMRGLDEDNWSFDNLKEDSQGFQRLVDIRRRKDAQQGDRGHVLHKAFARSRWFRRGWTLQELIAPEQIKFFGPMWTPIGTKEQLCTLLASVTGISSYALECRDSLNTFSVATRMSWAANRQTSRIEDRAYSLLGIFDVNMPMLYGESHKAFERLQEEIVKTSTDQSVFAWKSDDALGKLFASSPDDFADSSNIIRFLSFRKDDSYNMSNRGLEIRLGILRHTVDDWSEFWGWGVLQCRREDSFTGPIALSLYGEGLSCEDANTPSTFYVHGTPNRVTSIPLEQAQQAEWTSCTILRRRPLEKDHNITPPRPGAPKVLLRTECYGPIQPTHWTVTKTVPASAWRKNNEVFPPSYSSSWEGAAACAEWFERTSTTEQAKTFAIAFYAPRDQTQFRLVIFEPQKILGLLPHDKVQTREIESILEHTEPSMETSKSFDWGSVQARAELTRRMDEVLYILRVFIAI